MEKGSTRGIEAREGRRNISVGTRVALSHVRTFPCVCVSVYIFFYVHTHARSLSLFFSLTHKHTHFLYQGIGTGRVYSVNFHCSGMNLYSVKKTP